MVCVCLLTDVPSWSELRQRGGDQAFPYQRDRTVGEETEENWYQLTAAADLPAKSHYRSNLLQKQKVTRFKSSYSRVKIRALMFKCKVLRIRTK